MSVSSMGGGNLALLLLALVGITTIGSGYWLHVHTTSGTQQTDIDPIGQGNYYVRAVAPAGCQIVVYYTEQGMSEGGRQASNGEDNCSGPIWLNTTSEVYWHRFISEASVSFGQACKGYGWKYGDPASGGFCPNGTPN